MKLNARGLLLGVLQLTIVLALGAKLLIDRARYPRVWAQTIACDPDSPIRGRYLSVRLRVRGADVYTSPLEDSPQHHPLMESRNVKLGVENNELVALPSDDWTGLQVVRWKTAAETVIALEQPVDFYIPEHASDPSRTQTGEQLWVEVTVPLKGLPRPIRLGIKKDGVLHPLNLN